MCSYLIKHIFPTFQVLIGVGGPNETLYFDDPKSAQYFAKKIWNWFLGGTEISDMRPFGG